VTSVNFAVPFKSKSSAIAATAIVSSLTISSVVVDVHYGWHSTPGIWTGLLGLPGTLLGAWIESYQTDPTSLGIAALAAMAATNWMFWFSVARIITAIRRKLSGT